MDIKRGGFFLYMLVSRGLESEIYTEYSSLRCEGLVGACDLGIFTCRARHIDVGVVSRYIPSVVCSSCGARAIGT